MGGEFFYYHAKRLAIDPKRPWQVCSHMGALCGKLATEEQAKRAVEALNADNQAGLLPFNLNDWNKRYLLEGKEP